MKAPNRQVARLTSDSFDAALASGDLRLIYADLDQFEEFRRTLSYERLSSLMAETEKALIASTEAFEVLGSSWGAWVLATRKPTSELSPALADLAREFGHEADFPRRTLSIGIIDTHGRTPAPDQSFLEQLMLSAEVTGRHVRLAGGDSISVVPPAPTEGN